MSQIPGSPAGEPKGEESSPAPVPPSLEKRPGLQNLPKLSADQASRKAKELWEARQFEEAIRHFWVAFLEDHNPAWCYYMGNIMLFELRQPAHALECYELSMKSGFADDCGVLGNRGVSLMALQRHEEALDSLRTAMKLEPNCLVGTFLVECYRKLGQPEDAASMKSEVQKRDPGGEETMKALKFLRAAGAR